MTFGARLQQLLDRHRMSQRELARRLERDPSTVNKWVANISPPEYENLGKIASAFGMSLSGLLSGVDAGAVDVKAAV